MNNKSCIAGNRSIMNCPLCNAGESRLSWLDRIYFKDRTFRYLECLLCGTLYCDPMPDDAILARMYGPEYSNSFSDDPGICDPKEPNKIKQLLKKNGSGTFIDYGCGDGDLLIEAKKLSWQALGVEFDPSVAASTAKRSGVRTISHTDLDTLAQGSADMLHLGDVIEHLPELNRQMPEILSLIKPGGLLIAQGPLEANLNLFTSTLRLSRTLRKNRRTEMAPYHVLLATAKGQREFFNRFCLEELEYSVHEVAWPAPSRLSAADVFRPRFAGMFFLRRISQSISALRPGRWGNRYFYVGRRI